MHMKIIFGFVLTHFFFTVNAQYTQQLRGIVTEQVLQQPLNGATISIHSIGLSTITDKEGMFRFANIPVGVYQITISYAGFKEDVLENIVVNSGKESFVNVVLEAKVKKENEVVLKAFTKKNKTLNDMGAVSTRAFTVEETQKYAAAINDPLRMATTFAGVQVGNDGNNAIVIRGNSPTGLLWRMEGIDIPNPNHFSSPGSAGGGVSILNSQLLSNSDFITGAFAAEYGNALSGVFDLKLRKGNDEKREYTLQAGVLGLSGAMEGPFTKNYKGSYLINYRYSTLALLSKMNIISNGGRTNFQDLSFNIYLPALRLGTFTLFGFGGLSDQKYDAKKDSLKWDTQDDRYNEKYLSNTGMIGITHAILFGSKLNIKTGIGYSKTNTGYDEDHLATDYSLSKLYTESFKTTKLILTTTLNYKFDNKVNVRLGYITNLIGYKFYRLSRKIETDPLELLLNTSGNTSTRQAFVQWQYKPSNNIIVNAGMHYFKLLHNNTSSVEPRLSAKWTINNKSSIAVGYGQHSQMQTLNVYFAEQKDTNGKITMPNSNLSLSKAHHYVLSYSRTIFKNLKAKAEVYYQQLYNIPVSVYDSSTLSTVNIQNEYFTDPLENKGKGKNYGVEISIEQNLQNNFYLTFSNSIYQSKYKAKDQIERNTRFNGNYISTITAGKEFVNEKKSKVMGVNVKTIFSGGYRNTPVDIAASRERGYTVYREKEAFSLQNPAYFRTDLRLSIKWNRKYVTSTLSLDIQNITNRLNVYSQSYDSEKNKIVTNYQNGLIPVLNFKIDF